MPPPQTKLTPKPGSDAAGLPFDFAIASVKDALSETETAEPPIASTRRVLGSLKGYWRALQERRKRQRLRVSLHGLSDRQLIDIGMAPGDIECIAAYRAFEGLRDGTTYLWLSRGVM
jgi:uncharacterized protein YjiS (DUF1127 family)